MIVGEEGLVVNSPRGEYLMRVEVDAGPSSDTRVIVPQVMLDSQTVTLLREGEEG